MVKRLLTAVFGALLIGALPAASAFADLPPIPVDLPTLTNDSGPSPILIDPPAVQKDSGPTLFVAAGGVELKGLFLLAKGECTGTGVKGTYFQMIDRSGSPITNTDSPCSDKSLNPLAPGTEGGLSTTGVQPHGAVVFDANGNGLTRRITLPAKFFSVDFAVATNAKDPQTKLDTVVPRIVHDGNGKITADSDLRAFAAAWNGNQASQAAGEGHYNQGAPKPDGQTPGLTKKASGTYNSSTRAFVIEWTSMIVGGAFDQNGGRWHLEGTFDPAIVIGDPVPQAASVKGGATSRVSGQGPASTGPAIVSAAGVTLLGAGSTGLALSMIPPLLRSRRGRRGRSSGRRR